MEFPMETQELRKAGLKVTQPRMRILEILETSSGKHMTAEDIYRELIQHHSDVGLATVYRVLTQFEAAGLVLKHNFEGGQAVYELDRASTTITWWMWTPAR
jgi:Fur family ferric uptake transcriptional regulator